MRVYVLAPAYHYTGGVTALYQLCKALNDFGVISYIGFYDYSGKHSLVHPNYETYACPHVVLNDITDANTTTVIVPESRPDLLSRFRKAQKILYWLSVDHFIRAHFYPSTLKFYFLKYLINEFFVKFHNFLFDIFLFNYKQSLRFYRNAFIADFVKSVIENKSIRIPHVDIHIVQSEYARTFLIQNLIPKERIVFLHEPLESEFLSSSSVDDNRSNIIAWNVRKAYPIASRIILQLKRKGLQVVELENVGKHKLIKILKRSRIFIDIGIHPGRDRPPREAVVLGNITIVNNHGGCYFYDDCMIPTPFKIDCYSNKSCRLNVKEFIENLLNYLENYDYYYNRYFWKFKEFIKREPELYLREVENLAKLIER